MYRCHSTTVHLNMGVRNKILLLLSAVLSLCLIHLFTSHEDDNELAILREDRLLIDRDVEEFTKSLLQSPNKLNVELPVNEREDRSDVFYAHEKENGKSESRAESYKVSVDQPPSWLPVEEYANAQKRFEGTEWQDLAGYHKMLLYCSHFKPAETPRWKIRKQFHLEPYDYVKSYKNPCWWDGPLFERSVNEPHLFGMAMAHSLYNKTSARLRCLPYFYLAGAPKSATTDIHWSIVRHPDIAGTGMKETQFWTKFAVGLQYHEWFSFDDYIDGFGDKATKIIAEYAEDAYHPIITADYTASYLYLNDRWPLIPENAGLLEPAVIIPHLIHQVTPQAKIIISLRDPIERLYSHYYQDAVDPDMLRPEPSPEHFHRHVVHDVATMKACIADRGERACVYDACLNTVYYGLLKVQLRVGMYYVFIKHWLEVFHRDKLKIILCEDYQKERAAVVQDIFEFLDLAPMRKENLETNEKRSIQLARLSKFSRQGTMLPETRAILREFYQPYNDKLAELLDNEKFRWLPTSPGDHVG